MTLQEASTNIVFIDTAVIDYQSLLAGIILGSEVVILDSNQDGLTQITEFLAGRKSNSVQSVHIVSHGGAGSLQLGSTDLNLTNLNTYTNQLQKWGSALTDNADILLYGCDVASGEGTKFVQFISQITGADIAASTDKTGSAALGGDWDLEVKTGKIEASLAFQPEVIQAYNSILPASFTGTYSQNFDTLANSGTPAWTNDSTILGWYATRLTYNVGTGTSNAGALYSFGSTSATERALGSIASGTTGTIYYGLRLTNNTGSTITTLRVSYTGEQWRNGGNTTQQQLKFSYQTGTTFTSLPTGTLTSATSLDFTGTIATATQGSLDGNATANQVVISSIIELAATPIAIGGEIILRWEDINDTGNEHGLAIDDLTVTLGNTAPTLDNTGNPALTAIAEDVNVSSNPGSLVSAIIASGAGGNPITDIDSGAVEGIAVTNVDNTNGIWQYSTDGGTNWNNFTVSATSATLLRDTVSDRIRFVPNPDFNGSANITFRAWDASDGNTSGTTGINPGVGGNATAYSTEIETASIIINAVDDTTFLVTNTNDSGVGSLRQAIIDANNDPGVETILFDTSVTGVFGDATPDTITLTSGELDITEGIIIQGTGADKLIISGNNASRVFSASAPLTIDGLKITEGYSNGYGGGIYSNSSVTVSDSTISGNSASRGGGIYSSSIVTVSDSTISANTSDSNAGGIYSGSIVAVNNSTISGNLANKDGGGIRSNGGTISNSTITNNTADKDNNTTGNGGGIYNLGGTFSISNSIIAGNIDIGNQAPDVYGANFNGDAYNLIGSLAGKSSGTLGTGTDIVNPNPGLELLANNGGSTQTHALQSNSPAVNAGDPSYSGGLTTDQRGTGFNRIKFSKLDIGAFESNFGNASPKVSFGAATYDTTEGSNATTVAIAVTLDATPNTDVTVPIVINNSSTATGGDDYTFSPASLTFIAGATGADLTQLVTFTINPDDLPENAETVVLNFGTLTGADAGIITETTLNIVNNDSIKYAISTNTTTLTEDNTQLVTFTVTRSCGIGVVSTVDYAIDGTATFGTDYNNIQVTNGGTAAFGTLNFAVGETTKTITVDVLGDNTFELDEDITVTLSTPNLTTPPESSTITTSSATANIINDDNQPTISISNTFVNEGNTGTANANFNVTLSNASYQQVTVNYNTSDGTAKVSDSDYNSGTGTIAFAPGEISKNISFGVTGDRKFETNETFNVDLADATNATITDILGVAVIINDDDQPRISISDVLVNEGSTGMTTNAKFTITLTGSISERVIVNYSTSDGTATSFDSDYNFGIGAIIFNSGETSKILSIGVRGDRKVEANETFLVNLYGAANAIFTDNQGVGTIKNDDR